MLAEATLMIGDGTYSNDSQTAMSKVIMDSTSAAQLLHNNSTWHSQFLNYWIELQTSPPLARNLPSIQPGIQTQISAVMNVTWRHFVSLHREPVHSIPIKIMPSEGFRVVTTMVVMARGHESLTHGYSFDNLRNANIREIGNGKDELYVENPKLGSATHIENNTQK